MTMWTLSRIPNLGAMKMAGLLAGGILGCALGFFLLGDVAQWGLLIIGGLVVLAGLGALTSEKASAFAIPSILCGGALSAGAWYLPATLWHVVAGLIAGGVMGMGGRALAQRLLVAGSDLPNPRKPLREVERVVKKRLRDLEKQEREIARMEQAGSAASEEGQRKMKAALSDARREVTRQIVHYELQLKGMAFFRWRSQLAALASDVPEATGKELERVQRAVDRLIEKGSDLLASWEGGGGSTEKERGGSPANQLQAALEEGRSLREDLLMRRTAGVVGSVSPIRDGAALELVAAGSTRAAGLLEDFYSGFDALEEEHQRLQAECRAMGRLGEL